MAKKTREQSSIIVPGSNDQSATLQIEEASNEEETKTSRSGLSFKIDEEGQVITAIFSHGKQIVIRAAELQDDIQIKAKLHGLKQKLGDAAAISRNPETGQSATIEDKYNAVLTVADRLTVQGLWNAPREGGGGASGGLLFAALCRLYPNKTAEDIREYLAKKSDAEKSALRINPRVVDMMERIRAERLRADSINSDDLLGELG